MSEERPSPSARGLAARFLERVLDAPAVPESLGQEPAFVELPPPDRNLCHELVYGTLRNLTLLDAVLTRMCRRPIRHLDPLLLNTLRSAAYQILFLQRVPAYAAVSEAVRESRAAGFGAQAGFANAVLRRVARIGDLDLFLALDPASPAGLAVRYSHPLFLVERWLDRYPPDDVRRWLERSNRSPEHFITVQTRRVSPAEFQDRCRRSGVDVQPAWPGLPVVRTDASLADIRPLLEEGLGFPQDLWAHGVTAMIPGGDFRLIWDCCAAPGGKSFSLALRFPAARLVAQDLSPARLRVMAGRARTLGLADLHLMAGDACRPAGRDGFCDLVLVDAPCTGTGTLQKNPDIRWKVTPEDIPRLSRRQSEILSASARLVAPGGLLAYMTCSAEPEENERVAADFLRQQGTAYAVAPPEEIAPQLITPDGYFQSFPRAEAGEGFFCAIFRKSSEL